MSEKSAKTTIAWQGWRLEVPARWNPVRVEGDFNKGFALFADLHRPRLGIQWQRPRARNFDLEEWSQRVMREEVGRLAAEEARAHEMPEEKWGGSTLYLEPEPPGRDVWIGFSRASGRGIEVIHHARRRERILAEAILPTLEDVSSREAVPWSIFELSCVVPGEMPLKEHKLNAGDLSLTFANRARRLTVRQLAVAQLALKRLPLDGWIRQQQGYVRRYYRPVGEPIDVSLDAEDGRKMRGRMRRMVRRRRYFFMRWRPAEFFTFALHDESRDRLVIVEATDRSLAEESATRVGWATGE